VWEVKTILGRFLADFDTQQPQPLLRLPLPDGKQGVFRTVNSIVYDQRGHPDCIIGKLVDVSEDMAEKEELLAKSQRDESTGLYNGKRVRNLIIQRLRNKAEESSDAFMIIDCDDFKGINDSFGHLVGNQMLERLAELMRQNFRNSDILGRIGGDEFCVYMLDVPSAAFVEWKCQEFIDQLREDASGLSVGIGGVLLTGRESYEALFQKADYALYQAIGWGKGQVVFYDGGEGR
jgi:diguanylate cyclase (GGDEF)-like protein